MRLVIKSRIMKSKPEGAYENMLEHLRYIGSVKLLEWKKEGEHLVVEVEPLSPRDWVDKYAIPRIKSFLDVVEVK